MFELKLKVDKELMNLLKHKEKKYGYTYTKEELAVIILRNHLRELKESQQDQQIY